MSPANNSGDNNTCHSNTTGGHADFVEQWPWHSTDIAVKSFSYDQLRLYLFKGEPLPSKLQWADDVLSSEEHARAQRFVFDLHRNRFRFRRAALRYVLATEKNVLPTDIRFANNCYGKPFWANRQSCQPFYFNLSHSSDAVAIAVSNSHVIGVDIEHHRVLPEIHSMARMVMHPSELAVWQALSEAERSGWFFNLWALKEAVLKCIGCGLAIEPATFSVDPAAPLEANRSVILADPNKNRWTMQTRRIASFDGFSAAITLAEPGAEKKLSSF